jgi:hypothetical protein
MPEWQIGRYGVATDEDMARDGWVPVVEADSRTVSTLRDLRDQLGEARRDRDVARRERDVAVEARRDATEDMVRERERAVEAEKRVNVAEARAVEAERRDAQGTRVAQGVIADLQQEVDRLERIIQAPLSMRDLQVAWENAEQGEARPGDLVIGELYDGGFQVYVAEMVVPGMSRRILSRAPRPEWQDLADILLNIEVEEGAADKTAKWLHERGVRVVGGEEA